METWYRVDVRYGYGIEPVDIKNVTPNCVVFPNGRRVSKESAYDKYVPTLEEAKEIIKNRCIRAIDYHRKELETAQQKLKDIMTV